MPNQKEHMMPDRKMMPGMPKNEGNGKPYTKKRAAKTAKKKG